MLTTTPPEGAQLDAALAPIRRAVVAQTRTRRRVRRWGLATTGAALALSCGLVALNLVGVSPLAGLDGSRGGATAEAAELLDDAATLSIGASDPVVGPGQYLRIETKSNSIGSFGLPDGTMFSAAVPETSTVYEPADPEADWVLVRKSGEPTAFYPAAEAERWAAEYAAIGTPYPEGTIRAQDGAFYGPEPWADPDVESMPTDDPQKTLAWFDDRYTGGSSNKAEDTFVRATDLLRQGTVRADQRAAIYGMLTLVPGVTITDATATLDGRTGVALGRDEPARDGERQEIVIDPETGAFIGERILAGAEGYEVPAGEVTGSTSVTTTVVDTAP